MKNSTLIITSLIGGAILGSVATCFVKSTRGQKIKSMTREKIIEDLRRIHEHIGHICQCSQTGECSCSMSRADAPSSESEKPAEGI